MDEKIKALLIEAGFKIFGDKVIAADFSSSGNASLCSVKLIHLLLRDVGKSLWTEECHTSDLALEEFNIKMKKINECFGIDTGESNERA